MRVVKVSRFGGPRCWCQARQQTRSLGRARSWSTFPSCPSCFHLPRSTASRGSTYIKLLSAFVTQVNGHDQGIAKSITKDS